MGVSLHREGEAAPGDFIWPSSNMLEIPDLVIEGQARGLDAPFIGWGGRSRGRRIHGTYHFYCDDYRFSQVWQHPERVVATGCTAVVEPNFSVFDQTPLPVAIWNTYRKRWLARYWQACGLAVFVDLNVAETHAKLNVYGVPPGYQSFATHGYAERIEDLDRELQIAKGIGGGSAFLLVYGGGEPVARWCSNRLDVVHIAEGKKSTDWAGLEAELGQGQRGKQSGGKHSGSPGGKTAPTS